MAALTSVWPDERVEVFLAVVVRELFTGLDGATRENANGSSDPACDAVRLAGVIDVPRDVRSRRSVDRPFCIDCKKVSRPHLVRARGGDPLSAEIDHVRAARDLIDREEPQSDARARHPKSAVRACFGKRLRLHGVESRQPHEAVSTARGGPYGQSLGCPRAHFIVAGVSKRSGSSLRARSIKRSASLSSSVSRARATRSEGLP